MLKLTPVLLLSHQGVPLSGNRSWKAHEWGPHIKRRAALALSPFHQNDLFYRNIKQCIYGTALQLQSFTPRTIFQHEFGWLRRKTRIATSREPNKVYYHKREVLQELMDWFQKKENPHRSGVLSRSVVFTSWFWRNKMLMCTKIEKNESVLQSMSIGKYNRASKNLKPCLKAKPTGNWMTDSHETKKCVTFQIVPAFQSDPTFWCDPKKIWAKNFLMKNLKSGRNAMCDRSGK